MGADFYGGEEEVGRGVDMGWVMIIYRLTTEGSTPLPNLGRENIFRTAGEVQRSPTEKHAL